MSTGCGADGNLAAMEALESQTLPARMTLISHAPTLATKRASFPLDEPLLEGESQKISATGWTVPRAQYVWCGPEQRTRQTAEALGLKPSVVMELSDVDYGSWGGKPIEDVQESDLEGLTSWLTDIDATPHGGESLAHLIARVQRWMDGQTNAGHIIAVTHPAVIRAAIICTLLAPAESFWKVEVPPLSITDLRFNGRFWTMRSAGNPIRWSYENSPHNVTD